MGGCLRCGRCCTGFGVCVTPFDILRLSEAAALNAESFVMAIPEPPERERTEPAVIIDGKSSLIVLRWAGPPERKCIFYSQSGCTAYASRPMLCRTYPFKNENGKLAITKSRACPRAWIPSGPEGYRADNEKYAIELSRYGKIAQEWNRGGGGTLLDFLEFAVSRAAKDVAPSRDDKL
jgi:Fe-S-cluster containining protein